MIKRVSIQGAHPPSGMKFPDISLSKIYFFLTFFHVLNGLLLPYSRPIHPLFTNSDSNKSNVKVEQLFLMFSFIRILKGGYLDFSHLTKLKNIYITEIYMKIQYKSSRIMNHRITNETFFDGVPLKGYIAS